VTPGPWREESRQGPPFTRWLQTERPAQRQEVKMASRDTTPMLLESNERQRRYVDAQKARGGAQSIVFVDAFLRGMRDLGYKDPVWALAELLDNSIQAAATRVSVMLGFTGDSKNSAKPDHVAVIDDGVGMIPEMITYAVMWGGTDRENDRTGFGRYGYGLPSAAISLAKRYTVYSKVSDGGWNFVTVDIEQLALAAGDPARTRDLLTSKPGSPPDWVTEQSTALRVNELEHGTIIVLEDLDRLRLMPGWITAASLRSKIKDGLGTIYRHWIPERVIITVDNDTVQPTDPLFLMEHARFYDETRVRAQRVRARVFEVETPQGQKGTLRIRASLLPPNFQLKDPDNYGVEDELGRARRGKLNSRFAIMKAYNGILVCREGRQIDTIQPPFTKFQNYDVNVKIEVDFDPTLDEAFGITTSKQQIVIEDWMWDKLKGEGRTNGDLYQLIYDIRKESGRQRAELAAQAKSTTQEDKPRPSAAAMAESEKFTQTRSQPSEGKRREGEKNLQDEAAEIAKITGTSEAEIVDALIEKTQNQRYEIEFKAIEEGPFFLPKRLGEQKRVIINTAHPFYTRIYLPAGETHHALEVLLLVLGDAELEAADGDPRAFYKAARQQWSERLRHALESMASDASLQDAASAVSEDLHMGIELEADV
jgi:hypothetical protein